MHWDIIMTVFGINERRENALDNKAYSLIKNCAAMKISHWQTGFPFYWDTRYSKAKKKALHVYCSFPTDPKSEKSGSLFLFFLCDRLLENCEKNNKATVNEGWKNIPTLCYGLALWVFLLGKRSFKKWKEKKKKKTTYRPPEILDWTCRELWTFLLKFGLTCDRGWTG